MRRKKIEVSVTIKGNGRAIDDKCCGQYERIIWNVRGILKNLRDKNLSPRQRSRREEELKRLQGAAARKGLIIEIRGR